MHCWFAGYDAFHAVFPLVVRPEMLGIMAVMEQKDALVVVSGHGMCKVGFAGFASRAVFLSRF